MLSNRSGFVIRALHGKCSNRTLASSPSSSFVTSRADIADGGRTRAVVLVLGFGGAKPRHIAKYAQLYNGKGCSTVAGTASNHAVFVDHGELDAFAKDAVQQVTKLIREDDATKPNPSRQKETPVVMHIISNGGAFVARKIGGMLDSRKDRQRGSDDLELFATRLKLGCQVFDSAPCYNSPKSSFNVIKHLIPNPLISVPAAVMFTLKTVIIPRMVSMVTGQPTHSDLFWNALLEDANCNRQAFLYSEDDDIADGKMIEEFIEGRKKRGVCVMAEHFEDSVHVQHLRLHGKVYSAFIDTVLSDMEESSARDR